ncbi:Ig-like domain-containing protein [Arthrobacter russicus]|uniref:LPXTG-motif cell wall-anchored protein n=1 Tax=Arthrobacter russicus TaxID=172040 RepID=A0ABU1JDN2_9MICC|nr:LPXTG cell wall anchor domain-containing protein [Arthrobacter russicus]MDR6270515.1 LPXTG-motif cell wall-anchored protein [Arthrobacter russicus]
MKFSTSLSAGIGALALVAGLLFMAQPAAAAGIEIPDPELKACINENLGQSAEADISQEQALSLESVTCNAPIWSFSGIEQLSNLRIFTNYQASPNLSDLSALSELTQLQRLGILGSSISDLTPLKSLTNLNRIHLPQAKISDVSPLAHLPNLRVVGLDQNHISDFRPLKNLLDRKGIVRGAQFVELPPVNVGAKQPNPAKGPNGEFPRTSMNPNNAQGTVAADGSSWSFSKAASANDVAWDFENLPYDRDNFNVIGIFTQASLADDSVSASFQTPIVIDVLANDGLTTESPLDPATLSLLDAQGSPVKTLTVAAGTFDVIDGKIRFTPAVGFSGTVPAVNYQVSNADGITSTAKITITVGAAPEVVTPPATTPEPVKPVVNIDPAENGTKTTAQENELANTGASPSTPLALAGLLLLAGTAVVFFTRRRIH